MPSMLSRQQIFEWPTVCVAMIIYSLFALLCWYYHVLPVWLIVPIAAYLIAWHGSLQHEIIHGHPTPYAWLNRALVFPSLWLWMPYELYRDSHQQHHRNEHLTDPLEDPESYYLTQADWLKLPSWQQRLRWFNNTLFGRLLIGPVFAIIGLLRDEYQRIKAGDYSTIPVWAIHIVACAVVLFWVIVVCQIPLLDYLLLFVYPGISLSLLRSFLEHRTHPDWRKRTVIIEAHPLLALLFLNNNLHVLHHAEPGLAWYRLPARWHTQRDEFLNGDDHYYYSGYATIVTRYGLRAKETPFLPTDELSADITSPPLLTSSELASHDQQIASVRV